MTTFVAYVINLFIVVPCLFPDLSSFPLLSSFSESLWFMPRIQPFQALRPTPESAARVASVPYDGCGKSSEFSACRAAGY
jgi:hypothetical protein